MRSMPGQLFELGAVYMKKILVLEDEANIRSFVVINLRRSGYEPSEAENGAEALEKLKVNPRTSTALRSAAASARPARKWVSSC